VKVWRLEVEYEGTRYGGWQRQPHARTVQGELTRAAEEFFGAEMEVGGSGRTDAGVHALRQVAHLKKKVKAKSRVKEREERSPSARQIHAGLNQLLPHDINVLRVEGAAPNFHARHDARARYYLYQISTRRTAFAKPFVWWVRDRLDVALMARAAELFEGTHDFRSFCEASEAQRSTLVRVESARVFAHDGLILFRVGASHFLWKMVRRLVGALVEVGRGNLSIEGVRALLERYSNEPAAWTAPPSGLFLERVLYEGDAAPDSSSAFHFNFGSGL
jgi:tRNA pseudouridine38-40 synthase